MEEIKECPEYRKSYDSLLLTKLQAVLDCKKIETILKGEKRFRNIYERHPNLLYTMTLQARENKQKREEVLILYSFELHPDRPKLAGVLDVVPENSDRPAHCKVSEENFELLKGIADRVEDLDTTIEDVKLSLDNTF